MADYDVVVIGGGPGGYVAAIRCSQLGLKTACIDKWVNASGRPSLGGTCLNVGCIPSKALLDTSHHYFALQHQYPQHGINVENASIDIATVMKRKDDIVKKLTAGVSSLFLKNKVDWLKGAGKLLSNNTVEITDFEDEQKKTQLSASHIIIAVGSVPADLEAAPYDDDRIVDSTGALSFSDVPGRLGVIGGGVVGLEMGSVWSRFGAQTTILARGTNFLRSVDQEIAKMVHKELEAQGLTIHLGAHIQSTEVTDSGVIVKYTLDKDSKEHSLEFDKVLVAAGRRPNTENLCNHDVGLIMNQRGFIEVDDLCRTSLQGVYAIGDCVRGPMLAHKASEEGVAVAEMIAGQSAHVDFNKVPWVIYVWPEVAWVGKTTEQLQEKGIAFKSGSYPMFANGRAMAMNEPVGLIKVLADESSDAILGIHIYAPNASELIGEAVLALEFSASSEDVARTIHAHPTLSEALHEAALGCDKRAIHF